MADEGDKKRRVRFACPPGADAATIAKGMNELRLRWRENTEGSRPVMASCSPRVGIGLASSGSGPLSPAPN